MLSSVYEKEWRAFLGFPKSTILVGSQDSQLYRLLISPENSPQGFSWYFVQLTQSGDSSSQETLIGDAATSILGGFYRSHEIRIINEIDLYKNSKASRDAFLRRYPKDTSDLPHTNLAAMSDLQYQECLHYAQNIARCSVRFVYLDKIFFIEFKVYDVLDYSIAEDALNKWLNKLKSLLP